MDRVAEAVVTFVVNAAWQSAVIALIGIGSGAAAAPRAGAVALPARRVDAGRRHGCAGDDARAAACRRERRAWFAPLPTSPAATVPSNTSRCCRCGHR